MKVQPHSRGRAALITMSGSTANLLVTSIQAVVLIPLYLHYVGPRLYGAWLGSGDVFYWLQSIDLVLPLMVQRIGMAHGRKDRQAVGEYFAAGFIVSTIVATLITLAAVGLSYKLPIWIGLQGSDAKTLQSCFQLGAIATALQMINNCAFGLSLGVQDTAIINGVRVLSAIVGLGVSLWFLLSGWGLWAIIFGMISRTGVATIGGIFFVTTYFRKNADGVVIRVPHKILKEFILISPAMALGNFGYALMNQSESALAAVIIRPELATVLTLTRKLVEIVQALVDIIGFSVYGSLAHLATSEQRHRTLRVHAEIISLRLSAAVVLGTAYIAVNSSLVSLWVGSVHYGGIILTILFAMRMIIVGQSYLVNYLYRSIGSLTRGSVALIIESVVRVSLMIGGLLLLNLPGLPIAGIMTAIIFGPLAYHWTVKNASQYAEVPRESSFWLWIARIVILCSGVLVGIFLTCNTWFCIFLVGAAITLIGGVAMLCFDPLLGNKRSVVFMLFNRFFNTKDSAGS